MEQGMEPKAEGWVDHSTEFTIDTNMQDRISPGQIERAIGFLEGDINNPEHVKIAIELIKKGREQIKNSQKKPYAQA